MYSDKLKDVLQDIAVSEEHINAMLQYFTEDSLCNILQDLTECSSHVQDGAHLVIDNDSIEQYLYGLLDSDSYLLGSCNKYLIADVLCVNCEMIDYLQKQDQCTLIGDSFSEAQILELADLLWRFENATEIGKLVQEVIIEGKAYSIYAL